MLKLLELTQTLIILKLVLVHQCAGSANYLGLSNVYNAPTNGLTFTAPLPCDSPPPPPSYDTTFYNHPPLQYGTSFPITYSTAPHFKYAVAAPVPAPAPTFVRYSHEPRVKVTHGAPITTTYTTALGFAAPAVQGALQPTSSYAAGVPYGALSNIFTPSSYVGANFVSPFMPPTRFRAPLPVDTYSYAQGVPSGIW